jgi:general secretion pathway protein K
VRRDRRGFALLAVLWVLVGVSAVAVASLLVVRTGVAAARNRVALARARWQAEDCLERARAVIDDAVGDRHDIPRPVEGGWDALDRVVTASPAVVDAACDIMLRPTGVAIDANRAGAEQLRALLAAAGVVQAEADSMTDALLDWRDGDDIPRPLGAERAWYQAARRRPPRNGALADVRELRDVRGFGADVLPDSVLTTLFTVEPGRIVWDRAPLVVLASLPGMSAEAVDRLADARAHGVSITDVATLSAGLSPGARDALSARYGELAQMTTGEPDGWVLVARGRAGSAPVVSASIDVLLVRAGPRVAIVRRRTTP